MTQYSNDTLMDFIIRTLVCCRPPGNDYESEIRQIFSETPDSKKKRALKEAIGDLASIIRDAGPEGVRRLEADLKEHGLPSYVEILAQHSNGVQKLLKKRRLRDMTEVYILKDARDSGFLTEDETIKADKLLETWEF